MTPMNAPLMTHWLCRTAHLPVTFGVGYGKTFQNRSLSLCVLGPMSIIYMDAKTSHLLLIILCIAKKSILVNWKWRISSAQFSKLWLDHNCVVRTAFSKNQSEKFHHFWSPILFHDLVGWGWFGPIAHGPSWSTGWCRGEAMGSIAGWPGSLGAGVVEDGSGGLLWLVTLPRGGSCLLCLLSAPGELGENRPSYQGKGGVWWHLGCNAVEEMVTIFI